MAFKILGNFGHLIVKVCVDGDMFQQWLDNARIDKVVYDQVTPGWDELESISLVTVINRFENGQCIGFFLELRHSIYEIGHRSHWVQSIGEGIFIQLELSEFTDFYLGWEWILWSFGSKN